MRQAHIVIAAELRPAVEAVATILSCSEFDGPNDFGFLLKIESDLLPEGYSGVVNAVLKEGRIVRFDRDVDV